MKFSVIIPVYNVAPYLGACLDSVLAAAEKLSQPSTEVICVDDGSTDGSGAILDAYAARTPRLRVIHQKNAGVSAARNAGMAAATGDYVVFVDADDAVVPWFFKALCEAIGAEPGCDIYMFGAQNVADFSESLPERETGRIERVEIDNASSARVAYERVNGVLLAWGGCFRRELLADIRFLNYPNGEDALFGFTCLCHAKSIAFLNMPLYRYRLPRKGSANNATLRNLKSCLDNVVDYRKVKDAWPWVDSVKDISARKYRMGLVGVVYPIFLRLPAADRAEGRRLLLESFKDRFFVHDDEFPMADKACLKLAYRLRSLTVFHVFVYWPFAARKWLVRVPVVDRIKKWVRGS